MVPILSGLISLPVIGALVILILPRERIGAIRFTALLSTGLVLALAGVVVTTFDAAAMHVQFVERMEWIPQINAWYFLGVDGLSIAMVFLTALLGFLACIASGGIDKRHKEYFVLYLLLMTGMMGTFLALDLLLFYIFWEMVLIPMYFLIGIWGGPRRQYAAIKFFLYTLAGSVLMLVAILVAYFTVTPHTFDIFELARSSQIFDVKLQLWLFAAFYLAFAIKVPIFPFHTWLPDAHVEASTPISVLLAGVLLKMGAYGFFRIAFPIFPEAANIYAYPLAVLGAVSIVYGACMAMAQTDFKKMIAYSSVSHMGFVTLGLASLNPTGFNGALMEMFNHGIITGAMFLLVGVLYDRSHTRNLGAFGGLSANMPVYAFFLTLCSLASLGLPGLSGFVGEFLSLAGAFPVYTNLTIFAMIGLVVTAGYILYMIQRVLLGAVNPKAVYQDMKASELFTVIPLAVITVVVGFYPAVVLKFQEAAVLALNSLL